MFCSQCGTKLPDNSKFCHQCGSPVGKSQQSNIIRLRCEDCNGVMEIDESREVISCPYCGSKKIVLESDGVKIERMRNETKRERNRIYREIELRKAERDIELSNNKRKTDKEESRNELIALLVGIPMLLLMMILLEWLVW